MGRINKEFYDVMDNNYLKKQSDYSNIGYLESK